MAVEHFDVIIVGAGLSGVGAGVHLHEKCPGKSYVILEGRPSMGGTWDLFRYPGIRSDSDMHTLGYRFKPWREAKAIADGPSILNYVKETAAEYGVDRAHPLPAPGDEGRLVERGCHLDRRGAAQGHRRDRPLHLQLPLHVRGLLQLPAGLHARVRGHRALQGHDRPSAAVAGRPRLQGQEGGRDRLRRDGDDAGAGDGEGRRPHRHAAALADLRRVASRQGRDRERVARGAARRAGPMRSRAGRTSRCSSSSIAARARIPTRSRRSSSTWCGRSSGRTTTSRPTSRPATIRGTSASAWCRTAICSRRSAPARRRSSPTTSSASPRPASRSHPARSSTPTSSSRRRASTWSCSARCSSPSTARRSISRRPGPTRA